jgi:predicted transcriptional regulator
MSWFEARRRRTRTPVLGERELAILDVLWRHGRLSAQQIGARLPGSAISLSTVQSTLERLHRKGLVARSKSSRAYHYRPQVTREQIISSLLHDITEQLAGGDMAPVVSGFIAYIGTDDPAYSPLLDSIRPGPGNRDAD